ncbi:MAG TPA: bifunctional diaminohydroxyphosphoribosylaminopyrimidine deaminase/5-amino-6-(5-phosphoribosylamino)uracil reductase RibD [Actinobacteria bacterium]|nr:bifunctional diaminohydroxyphosphoribosylaminopyrimidine deaminase/5-amino-6-(5-phosphoribosylamino)uracil reductase RibD [Actinomycetota bacterium]
MSENEIFMKKAIALAEKGRGKVSPNPLVGALVVKNSKVISKGYHKAYGDMHAEVQALKGINKNIRGADLYITLEPCMHQGKTPPCLDLIKQYKFKNIIIGSIDPNPLMSGKSVRRLRRSGYKVLTGVLKKDIDKQNEAYFYYMKNKMPFVTMKAALTLDGKIATRDGDSKWITSVASRKIAHKLRAEHDAVMVGIGTVRSDDPMLTVRGMGNSTQRQPVRVILDSNLKIPLNSQIVKSSNKYSTVVACKRSASKSKAQKLKDKGIEVLYLPVKKEKVSLTSLMKALGKRNISSVLIEGGSGINSSALDEGIANKAVFIYAPKLVGGDKISVIGGNGAKLLKQAKNLKIRSVEFLDPDVVIKADI